VQGPKMAKKRIFGSELCGISGDTFHFNAKPSTSYIDWSYVEPFLLPCPEMTIFLRIWAKKRPQNGDFGTFRKSPPELFGISKDTAKNSVQNRPLAKRAVFGATPFVIRRYQNVPRGTFKHKCCNSTFF
jgi:hypothetical protein